MAIAKALWEPVPGWAFSRMEGWIQHGDVVSAPCHQIKIERLMVSVTQESLGWTLMLRQGCLAGNLPIQHLRGEQSRAESLNAQQAQPSLQLWSYSALGKHWGVNARVSF